MNIQKQFSIVLRNKENECFQSHFIYLNAIGVPQQKEKFAANLSVRRITHNSIPNHLNSRRVFDVSLLLKLVCSTTGEESGGVHTHTQLFSIIGMSVIVLWLSHMTPQKSTHKTFLHNLSNRLAMEIFKMAANCDKSSF